MQTATRRRSGRFIVLFGATAISACLLSGCSVVGGLDHVASCSRLASAGSDLKTSLGGLSAQSDPTTALSTVTTATDAFASAMKNVRDAKVKEKADAVTSALHTLAADLKTAAAAPSPGAATKLDADTSAVLDAAQAAKAVCE